MAPSQITLFLSQKPSAENGQFRVTMWVRARVGAGLAAVGARTGPCEVELFRVDLTGLDHTQRAVEQDGVQQTCHAPWTTL